MKGAHLYVIQLLLQDFRQGQNFQCHPLKDVIIPTCEIFQGNIRRTVVKPGELSAPSTTA